MTYCAINSDGAKRRMWNIAAADRTGLWLLVLAVFRFEPWETVMKIKIE